ncbi:MAG: orotidine-5'-phosphate decarboxylase [Myxococcales bacterium]|nr:MAG: orotidine-5'-phosphate decarboxylase [Myxococcales bacterium]
MDTDIRTKAKQHLACALDLPNLKEAQALARRIQHEVGYLKVGLELFTSAGSEAVSLVRSLGLKCFLDLKLHDIPATMARAAAAAADLGVDLLTVHASAGPEALSQVLKATAHSNMRTLAVTVLTSSDEKDLKAIGVLKPPLEQVRDLACMAVEQGVSGFVCAAPELHVLREVAGPNAFLVTPGIRPSLADSFDQKRVADPAWAVEHGSNLLVVGRPIRDAKDPARSASQIVASIATVLNRAESDHP